MPGSAYARMARMVVLEKGLSGRVEVLLAKTRTPESPYYAVNPSGRVPYLVCDDGMGLEESALICAYLDELDGRPSLELRGWEARRLEALARSLLDGLSVWLRETLRPVAERSPGVIAHERERARRLTDVWETLMRSPLLEGPLNMVQITLACALGLEARIADFHPRDARPRLAAWLAAFSARPSFAATAPSAR